MRPLALTFQTGSDLPAGQLEELYNSVGWLAYTSGEPGRRLPEAIRNSTFVVSAWHSERLVGLARCLSDDVAICYLQDILIHPDYQRQGVGRRLLERCLERHAHVRLTVLLTDDEARQKQFYESLGFKNINELRQITLNAYVRSASGQLA